MKEMLREFIERDFTVYEMEMVISVISLVMRDYEMIALHRKRGDVEMVQQIKYDLQYDIRNLRDDLDYFGLTYDVKDLVDDGGVEV